MTEDFNQERFFLGDLCRHGHEWSGTGHSLRYIKDRGCTVCKQEHHKRNKERILARKAEEYRSNPERKKAYNQEYRAKNLEKLRAKDRDRYHADIEASRAKCRNYGSCNREKKLAYMRQYHLRNQDRRNTYNRNYHHSNRARLIIYSREHYQQNRERCLTQKREDYVLYPEKHRQRRQANYKKHREKIRAKYKAWAKTPRGKAIRNQHEHKRRALKANNHAFNYSSGQIKSRYEEFNHCCCWCGKPIQIGGTGTLDHFIAISKAGPDNMGNLVPSCKSCNSSKQASDPKEWYERQEFYSKERWRRILKVLGKEEKTYNQLPLI